MALQLCTAIGISCLLVGRQVWRRRLGVAAALLIVGCGTTSGVAYALADTWWNKYHGEQVIAATKQIEQQPSPLVVLNATRGLGFGDVLSLIHQLSDGVRLHIVVDPNMPALSADVGDLFLWNPSPELLEKFSERGWRAEETEEKSLLRMHRQVQRNRREGLPSGSRHPSDQETRHYHPSR